ncbi:MAG: cytochrome P450 [Candidatus Rokuibacteriota bacterium]
MLAGGLPWLGHALGLRRDPVAFLLHGHARLGEVFSFRLAGTTMTALLGPRAHATFFRAADDQLSARDVYQFMVPIFGRGVVFDVAPEVMDEQMGFLFPALRDERLAGYARLMQEEAAAYAAGWADEGEIDLLAAFGEVTARIASRCLLGVEFRRRLGDELAALLRDLEGGISLPAMVNPHLPLPAFRRRDRARARIAALLGEIIAARRADGGGDDFLETLMAARYADGRRLDDEEIVGLLISAAFAGQHTSTVMGAWTGLLLLAHPEWLATVLDEQARVIGGRETITLDELRRLPALECAIKEAERMHPPLVMLMRRVRRDLEHDGFVVEAGGLAMISPAAAHRLPHVFAEPDRYDPGRFGPQRQEDRRTRNALIGFGGGHHRCIGATFAQQQIKVVWSVLLREFDLTAARADHRPDYATFVVGPRPPCLVRYRRRRRAGTAHAAAGGRA